MPKFVTSTPWASTLSTKHVELAMQFVQQAFELGPVGVVADAEDADVGGERFAAGDSDGVGSGHALSFRFRSH